MFPFRASRSALSLVLSSGALVLASCDHVPGPTEVPIQEESPVASAAAAQSGLSMQDRYIVLFQRNEADPAGLALGLGRQLGFSPERTYETAVKGFAARMSPQAVEALRLNPRVELVEPDAIAMATEVQENATWGLDRIDQRNLSLDGNYTYWNDGSGVHAYILDTGIRTTHTEFTGRVTFEVDFTDEANSYDGDCGGHGTHVAGTVGGTTYGVAKGVALHAVRVLDCGGSGWYSWIMDGIDWVAADQNAHEHWPAVINMSLSGTQSDALDATVQGAVQDGVVVVVSAGNNNGADACTRSPAAAENALTIGSSNSSDFRSSFSNTGTCVDLFAPGSSIYSSTHYTTESAGYMSGTSMAAPHVAGVAALYLSATPTLTPHEVMAGIVGNATSGVLSNVGTDSPNLLLYSIVGEIPDPPPATEVHVGDLTVTMNWGRRNSNGTAYVTVAKEGGGTVSDATVTGTWSAKGSIVNSGASGITDASGVAAIGSGALKNVREEDAVEFCVTNITGTNMEYDAGANAATCVGPTGAEPPTEPPTEPPPSGDFTLTAVVKAGKKVALTWTGSSAGSFQVLRDTQEIATTSLMTYTDEPGEAGTWTYQVCEVGPNPECTKEVEVTTSR